MIIENRQQDYEIRELSCSREAGMIRLRWRYKKATDFLVFLYDSRQTAEFCLEEALEELAAEGEEADEAAVLDSAKKLYTPGKGVPWMLLHRTKEDFVRDGRSLALPVSELSRHVPYGISVFACCLKTDQDTEAMYTKRNVLHVYPSSLPENTCFVPVRARAQIRYRKRLFSREKYGLLSLPRIADYRDGAVLYHVEGAAFDVPLPQACLGRELVITLPRQAKVSLRVREADQKYLAVQLTTVR
ncbi:MAG: hypothetical protein K2N87_16835 [Eubacterium sp.]|nr:hypothetical protein [Eubacterium sp.]